MNLPSPLDYRTPDKPPPRDPDAPKRFAFGLIGGTAISAAFYFAGWKWVTINILETACSIAAVKLLAFALMPVNRAVRLGILASIPLGALIFFGICGRMNS